MRRLVGIATLICCMLPPEVLSVAPKQVTGLFDDKEMHLSPSRISVETKVTANLASTAATLLYRNKANESIESALFKFPTTPDTAVFNITVQFESRAVLYGVVTGKDVAEQLYEDAINNGRSAIFVHETENQNNILQLNVGNIHAGEKVKITIWMVQELSLHKSYFRYYFPTSAIERPRNRQRRHIDEASRKKRKVPNVHLSLDFGTKSPKEVIIFPKRQRNRRTRRHTDGGVVKQGFRSTKDIQVWFPNAGYADSAIQDGKAVLFSHFISPEAYDSKAASVSLEYVLLVDACKDINTKRKQLLRFTLRNMIKTIPQGAYFNIIRYSTIGIVPLMKVPVKNLSKNRRKARNFLKKALRKTHTHYHPLHTSEPLADALEYVDSLQPSEGPDDLHIVRNPRQLFIVSTSGAKIKSEAAGSIVASATRMKANFRIFCLGLTHINGNLLTNVAKIANGYTYFEANRPKGTGFTEFKRLLGQAIHSIVSSSGVYVKDIQFYRQHSSGAYMQEENVRYELPTHITTGAYVNLYLPDFDKSQSAYVRYSMCDVTRCVNSEVMMMAAFSQLNFVESKLHRGSIKAYYGKREMQTTYSKYLEATHPKQLESLKQIIQVTSIVTNVLSPFTAFIGSEQTKYQLALPEHTDTMSSKTYIAGIGEYAAAKATRSQKMTKSMWDYVPKMIRSLFGNQKPDKSETPVIKQARSGIMVHHASDDMDPVDQNTTLPGCDFESILDHQDEETGYWTTDSIKACLDADRDDIITELAKEEHLPSLIALILMKRDLSNGSDELYGIVRKHFLTTYFNSYDTIKTEYVVRQEEIDGKIVNKVTVGPNYMVALEQKLQTLLDMLDDYSLSSYDIIY